MALKGFPAGTRNIIMKRVIFTGGILATLSGGAMIIAGGADQMSGGIGFALMLSGLMASIASRLEILCADR
jgi:hypothetical protein